jgi:tRNA(Ser,Leu) C12 N-acetylase TAN1
LLSHLKTMLSSQDGMQSSTELNERCLPESALSLYAEHEIQRAAGDLRMARKKRKLAVGKKKKQSRVLSRQKKRGVKAASKKRRSRNIGERLKSAYRTVVDSIKDTDKLRNKLEPPATSETE